MPNYWPLSSGNWSNLSNWLTANTVPFNASTLPTSADGVYANNKTIYVDGNYRVAFVSNLSASNISRGGRFVLNNNRVLSAFIIGGGLDDTGCVQFLSGEGTSATIFGSLCAGDPNALVSRPIAVQNLSAGTLNIFGNSVGGWKDTNTSGDLNNQNNGIIINLESGIINLVGNYRGDLRTSPSGISNNYPAIRNHSNGNIFLTGSIFGGAGIGSCGIYNHSDGNVSVFGTVSAGAVNQAHGIRNQSVGNVSVSGLITTGRFQSSGDEDTAGVTMFSEGSLYVTGNVLPLRDLVYAINLKGNSNAFILGDVNVGTATSPLFVISRGILHNSTGTLQITGNINCRGFGGTRGVFATNNGDIFIKGNLTGQSASVVVVYLFGGDSSLFIEGNIGGNGRGILADNNIQMRNISVIGDITGNPNVSETSTISGNNLNLTVIGNVNGSAGIGNNSHGIFCSGKVAVYGSVYGGDGTSNYGIDFGSGTIFLSGLCVGGSGASSFAINNSSGGIVSIIGTVSGGNGLNAHGISDINGEINVEGSVIGGNNALGIFSNNIVGAKKAIGNNFGLNSDLTNYFPAICANYTFIEEIECGENGVFPVVGKVYLNKTNNSSAIYRNDASGKITMFTSSSANLLPLTKDVRLGVKYDFENLTGTLAIPDPEYVKLGQITDNTIGKGTYTNGGAVWETPLSAINIIESMGERSNKILTIEEMGGIIKDLA